MADVAEGLDPEKRMRLRYAGVCRICGTELPAREEAIYERSATAVRCVECPTVVAEVAAESEVETPPVEVVSEKGGVAGSSARREYERRRAKDEERLRQKWGKLGGIAVAFSGLTRATLVTP